MPDLTPRSAFTGLPGRSGRAEGEPGISVRPRDDLALARVIARKGRSDDLAAAIRSRYGLDLPLTPKRVEQGALAAIWSGPGQWLVVAEPNALPLPLAGEVGAAPAAPGEGKTHPPEQPSPGRPDGRPTSPATRERQSEQAGFVRELADAISTFAAVSDQSDGLAVLRVSGPQARDALIKGVGLDLHPRAFGPGDAAVTVIAHVGAQLWQLDNRPSYEVAVYRSFAGSLWRWLEASAAEFGCAVEAG
ncbi:MAG TPA: sarcosine oxidase subunit gamma family protein [Inquilinus sp.]